MKKKLIATVIGIVSILIWGESVHAQVELNIYESGSNVIATDYGEVSLAGLSLSYGDFPYYQRINATNGIAAVGGSNVLTDVYSGSISGGSLGSGQNDFNANSSSGNIFGVYGHSFILVPYGYVSGSVLSGTSTFTNVSLASMGLSLGTYHFSWGGATDQAATVNVETVPEPSSYALFGLGALALVVVYRGRLA